MSCSPFCEALQRLPVVVVCIGMFAVVGCGDDAQVGTGNGLDPSGTAHESADDDAGGEEPHGGSTNDQQPAGEDPSTAPLSSERPPLDPGPDPADIAGASPTDLVIDWSGERTVLEEAVAPLGGDVVFVSDQLTFYLVRFETSSAAELAEIRDELRREGFDARFDIYSEDPTTGS